MSLKNDIDMVKEELNSEEKFFEKAVITEKFVKKYKNLMIGSVVVIALLIGGNIAYDMNKQSTLDAANMALATLETNPKDEATLTQLKTLSPSLHDVWVFSQAIVNKDLVALKTLKNSNALIVSDLVTYELAQNEKDSATLNDYSLKQGSIYKDLAQVQAAVLFINSNEIDKAHEKLSTIGEQSSLYRVAKALLHYGVK